MFSWLKKSKTPPITEVKASTSETEQTVTTQNTESKQTEKTGLFGALRQGLSRTRHQLTVGLTTLFLGKKQVDADLLKQIETQLLMADVGVVATQHLIQEMTHRIKRNELADPPALYAAIQAAFLSVLAPCQVPWIIPQKPYVILVVGVNGAGKTTTIGKLAQHFQSEGKSVLLAAGDTFRAAAVEQLKIWGERNKAPVIAQAAGADSASVIYDAFSSAQARGIDVLLADTAGRLHNQFHLMDELKKIKRVLAKLDPTAPHETILIIDAGIGQNALQQAKQFHESIGLNSMILTKLDGTAKGGTIFSLADNLHLPIRFIGVGESIHDLQPFDASLFIKALFTDTHDG